VGALGNFDKPNFMSEVKAAGICTSLQLNHLSLVALKGTCSCIGDCCLLCIVI
jgi:hypothetical protein